MRGSNLSPVRFSFHFFIRLFLAVVDSVVELGEACDTANEGVLKLLEAQEIIDAGLEDKTVKGVIEFLAKTTKVGTLSAS
jgi:hypothetical protein